MDPPLFREQLPVDAEVAELHPVAGTVAAEDRNASGQVGNEQVLAALDATRDVGIYAVDAVVRRSRPLQETAAGRSARGGDA